MNTLDERRQSIRQDRIRELVRKHCCPPSEDPAHCAKSIATIEGRTPTQDTCIDCWQDYDFKCRWLAEKGEEF